MASKKKKGLERFTDIDLRLARTNLLNETNQTDEVKALIADIDDECNDRGKNFISHISDEEYRCGWVLRRKPVSPEMEAFLEETIPNWKQG